MKKRIISAIICAAFVATQLFSAAFAEEQAGRENDGSDVYEIAMQLIDWKKADVGSEKDGLLMNEKFLELAGTTSGDWYPIGLGRLGVNDGQAEYLAVLREIVSESYKLPGKLSSSKSTEWHRISLAVIASGGDPRNFGEDENGAPIDLIADGTYDRGKTAPLGRQGINGWIWGLITLDSMGYEVPEGAFYSREDIIAEILKAQLPDGGFSLNGNSSDPDVTAMAVQALAPYYDSGKFYTYDLNGREVSKTPAQAIDEALERLSAMQSDDGNFESGGIESCESSAQVIIALCCLDIDPLTDNRFIKNGSTVLDGLLKYRMKDGGFAHSFVPDPADPSALPDCSNSMAGEQALLALAALWRQQNGMSSLYDMRDELSGGSGDIPGETVVFTSEDKAETDALPENPDSGYYTSVLTLLDKLERSEDFDGREVYKEKLLSAKEKIDFVKKEIQNINSEIKDKLYPYENIDLSDKKLVDGLLKRCGKLNGSDKDKIEGYSDLVRAKAKLDSALRGAVISVILSAAALAAAIFAVRRIYRRKHRREREMEELSRLWEDKDND